MGGPQTFFPRLPIAKAAGLPAGGPDGKIILILIIYYYHTFLKFSINCPICTPKWMHSMLSIHLSASTLSM